MTASQNEFDFAAGAFLTAFTILVGVEIGGASLIGISVALMICAPFINIAMRNLRSVETNRGDCA